MVKTQVVEHAGVMLRVDYEPANAPAPVTFHSIHVMDGEYRAVGPNLVPMMDDLIIHLGSEQPEIGGTVDAEKFLSRLAEDLT